MNFAASAILYLSWIILIIIFLYVRDEGARKRLLAKWGNEKLILHLTASLSITKRVWKKGLEIIAFFLILLALSRPLGGKTQREIHSKGIDIVIAVDVSKSMLAEDITPNRLSKAKQELVGLSNRLRGNRIGLVAFAGSAIPLCPLTVDTHTLGVYLDILDPGLTSIQGTNIGDAIHKSLKLFDPGKSHGRFIILLTDGEDLEGRSKEAALEAQKSGVRIYTIGIGTGGGEPIPEFDNVGNRTGHKRDLKGDVILSHLDEDALKEMATLTQGKYFRATQTEIEIDLIFDDLDQFEKGEFGEKSLDSFEEQFQIPLLLGFILLMVSETIGERKGLYSSLKQFIKLRLSPKSSALAVFILLVFPFLTGFSSKHLVDQGNESYHKGEYDQAINKYNEALSQSPKEGTINFNLGNSYYLKQSIEKAQSYYEKMLDQKSFPDKGSFFYSLGNCSFKNKKYTEALKWYKKAMESDSNDQDAKYNYEVTLQKIKDKKEKKQEKQKESKKSKEEQKSKSKKSRESKSEDVSKKNEGSQDQKDKTGEKKEDQKEESGAKEDKKKEQESTPEEKKKKDEKSGREKTMNPDEKKEPSEKEQEKDAARTQPASKNDKQTKEGMNKEEALRILDVVNDEKKDLLWNATRQKETPSTDKGKDW